MGVRNQWSRQKRDRGLDKMCPGCPNIGSRKGGIFDLERTIAKQRSPQNQHRNVQATILGAGDQDAGHQHIDA